MQAIATWKGRHEFLLEDGHAHSVTVDLPLGEGGRSAGPPPLELSLLSLAGSIASTFATVAERRRFVFYSLTVALEAEPLLGTATVSRVRGTLRVRTRAGLSEVADVLRLALRSSAVASLFERAGVPLQVAPVVMPLASPAGVSAERSGTVPG